MKIKFNPVDILASLSRIEIIFRDTFRQFLREKRFYIATLYYIGLPVLLVLFQSTQPVVQTGTGIAIYYAQLNATFYILTIFLTFFPGQVFLVIISADQIAGEFEHGNYVLFNSKPIHHFEIVIGKYLGLIGILSLLQMPTLLFIYYMNLVKYQAEWPIAYITSVDEVLAMLIIVILLQSVILGISLTISAFFDRSLYAILTSILLLFVISIISDNITASELLSTNYFSLSWYIDAVLPHVFFNLTKIDDPMPLWTFFSIMISLIVFLTICTSLILRNREVN
jgi:ABC-type transport system involved in multi-copper enzyme maturation permease subunit